MLAFQVQVGYLTPILMRPDRSFKRVRGEQITGVPEGALTAVSLFRRHGDGVSLSSGQGREVEGMTRKRSEVVPGCRGCRRFEIVERTINLQGVVAAIRPSPD